MEIITENLVPVSIISVILVLLLVKKLFSKPEATISPIDRQLKQQNKHAVQFGLQEIDEPDTNYDKLSQVVSKAYTNKQKNVPDDYIPNLKNELVSILESIGNYKPESIDDFINKLNFRVTSA